MAIVTLAMGFTACKNYSDPIISAPISINIDLNKMNDVVLSGTITIDTKDEFSEILFTSNYPNGHYSVVSAAYINGTSAHQFAYTPAQLEAKEGLKEIVITAKTAHDKITSFVISVTISSAYAEPIIDAPSEITINLGDMHTPVLIGTVTIGDGDAFDEVTFKSNFDGNLWAELLVDNIEGTLYSFAMSAEYLSAMEGLKDIVIKATTVRNKIASKKINVTIISYDIPTITVPSEVVIDLSYMDIPVLVGTVSSDVNDNLKRVVFASHFSNGLWTEIVVPNISGNFYDFSYSAEQLGANEGIEKIDIHVETINGVQASTTVDVVIIKTIPLKESEFTWQRTGATPGTGLEQFGLEWNSNTATNIVVTPAYGTTLVQFADVEKWNTITTLEELIEAFEAETPIDKFEEIPSKDDTLEFNYVIATKKADGTYYLINPTKRVFLNSSYTRIVTGGYKFEE